MARTSVAIDALVRELGLEPAERVEVQARMARHNRDCGCALGGATMTASVVAAVAYLAVTATFGIEALAAAAGVVFASALLGKALGLVAASVRLELLRRSLSRRARRLQEAGRVYVY